MAVMQDGAVFSGSTQSTTDSSERRLLVINLDKEWDFSRWCRPLALDLYRNREPLARPSASGLTSSQETNAARGVRASEVDFWDVRDVSAKSGGRDVESESEKDGIWRYWPRPIRGGVKGAIAELEEKLSEELVSGDSKQIELLTVLAVVDPRLVMAGEPTRAEEFLDGLERSRVKDYRRRVQVIIASNSWNNDGVIRPLRPNNGDRSRRFDLPDAIIDVSSSRMTSATPAAEDVKGFQMKLLRIIVDLLRSETFAKAFASYGKERPGSISRFHLTTTNFELHDKKYAATVVEALNRKHAETVQYLSNPVTGEEEPFIKEVRSSVGVRAVASSESNPKEREEGSYKIVNDVTKNFEKHIFPVAEGRRDPLIRKVFEDLAREDRPAAGLSRWLFRHRWAHAPMLGLFLERAFIEFLKRAEEAIRNKLGGQQSQLARHEELGVAERKRQVAQLAVRLTLDQFGTGPRAVNNANDARKIVDLEIEAVDDAIRQFWQQFEEEAAPPMRNVSDADLALLREHCPPIKVEWKEALKMLTCYAEARRAVTHLMSRPSPWLWLTTCAVICLQIPLLWLGVWGFGLSGTGTIPVLNLLIWIALFGLGLAGPFWVLRRGHMRVEKSLTALDDAARGIIGRIEEGLASVVEYVGIIQRHYFLYRLRDRIDSLDKEAKLIAGYIDTVESSLDPRSGEAVAADVNFIVSRLQGLPDRHAWLDVALRCLNLESKVTLQASLPGGASIPVATHLWQKPITVQVEPVDAG